MGWGIKRFIGFFYNSENGILRMIGLVLKASAEVTVAFPAAAFLAWAIVPYLMNIFNWQMSAYRSGATLAFLTAILTAEWCWMTPKED